MMATVAGKKLGILLSRPDSHPSVDTVVGLCNAALQQGSDAYLYLIDEGVKNKGEKAGVEDLAEDASLMGLVKK